MARLKAFGFYLYAVLEATGFVKSEHEISQQERQFAEFAISHSRSIVDCGPRLDIELVTLALHYGAEITLFEASPVFARKLQYKIKKEYAAARTVKIVNMGVSSSSGSLRYYFLNQSFVKDVPYRTYGFGRSVKVTSLDEFFKARNKPDFIKSDVEGLDIEVFKGAEETLKSLKYFQLEMCSTQQSTYLNLFKEFDLFLLLSENHPLWRGQALSPMETIGWKTVFDSMGRGETNILCGVRRGAHLPKF